MFSHKIHGFVCMHNFPIRDPKSTNLWQKVYSKMSIDIQNRFRGPKVFRMVGILKLLEEGKFY